MVEGTEDYTRVEDRDRPGHASRRHSAWYVWGIRQGQPVMFGPYFDSEDEAYKDASMKLDCQFEVVELNTIDSRRAWKILRKRMLDKTSNLEQSLKRAKHTV